MRTHKKVGFLGELKSWPLPQSTLALPKRVAPWRPFRRALEQERLCFNTSFRPLGVLTSGTHFVGGTRKGVSGLGVRVTAVKGNPDAIEVPAPKSGAYSQKPQNLEPQTLNRCTPSV